MAKIKSIQTRRPLPNKLSDLLDMAVEDAKRVKAAGHTLDMGTWYERRGTTCSVCMAGAVMLCELAPIGTEVSPFEFLEVDKLQAINVMRLGHLPCNVDVPEDVRDVFFALVNYNPSRVGRAPWTRYTRAAQYLREQGY